MPACVLVHVHVCVCVCDYLRFLRKDAGSLASSVLTRPNSCMTLSSCLRSSWPFSRNMNSWPLLPAEGAAHTHNLQEPEGVTQERVGWPDDELLAEGRGRLFPCCSVRRSKSAAVCGGSSKELFFFFCKTFHCYPSLNDRPRR